MLLALLKGKLKTYDADGGTLTVEDSVTGREDPLTAAVFGRLRYLPLPTAWALLREAATTLSGSSLPLTPPDSAVWRLWPRLSAEDKSQGFVEPDVLLIMNSIVVVFEVKHRGNQNAAQWRREILAVQRAYPGRSVALVAVGGADAAGDTAHRKALSPLIKAGGVSLHRLPWNALLEQAERSQHRLQSHERLVLDDIRAAVVHWSYRRREPLHTLVNLPPPTRDTLPTAWRLA